MSDIWSRIKQLEGKALYTYRLLLKHFASLMEDDIARIAGKVERR